MKNKKFNIMLTIITIMTLLLAGCSSSKETALQLEETTPAAEEDTSESSEPETSSTEESVDLSGVTLRVMATLIDADVIKAAGLDDTPYKVEFTAASSGQLALQSVATDQLDLVRTSELPPLFASLAEGGGNFKIVATEEGNTLNQALIVGPQSTAQSVADLKGQKVGYIKATTSQYFLLKMLDEAGLTWDDIEPVELQPADGLTALISGDIAAFAVFGNQIQANIDQGGKVLESAENILSGNYLWEASVIALEDPAKAAAIVDLLGRFEKTNEWIRNHYEDYAALKAEAFGYTDKQDFIDYLKDGDSQRPFHIRVTTEADLEALQDVSDTFFGIGLLEQQVDARLLYSNALEDDISKLSSN